MLGNINKKNKVDQKSKIQGIHRKMKTKEYQVELQIKTEQNDQAQTKIKRTLRTNQALLI